MRTKTRALFIAGITFVLCGAIIGGASAKPSGPGPGNSPNAKACQKSGWKTLYTTTGATFTSEKQCVSYASKGGTLLTSPPSRTLAVTKAGVGAGTVTGDGINCGSDCTQSYPQGSTVILSASPASGSTFAGWSGACSGMSCTITMSANQTVTATFDITPPPPNRTLTVSKTGTGIGTVTGPGINCGSDCTERYDDGADVTLTATADTGSTFTGWSGDCTGMTCSFTIGGTTNKTVVANFDTTLPTSSIALTAPQGVELFCNDDLAYNFLLVSGSGVLTSDDLPLGSGPVLHINDVTVPLEIHSSTGDFTDRPLTVVAGSGDTVYATGTSSSDGSTVTSNTITCP
jgi:hypothetical protein